MLSDPRLSFPSQLVRSVLDFSQGEYAPFFQGCGLYHVGSSLTRETYNDVDIVLVGMDFRAVIEYDKIFLRDPETLIEKEIVVEPYRFLVEAKDERDEPTVLTPMPYATDISSLSLIGIEHRGRRYDYNHKRFSGDCGDLDGYCKRHAQPSKLIRALETHVKQMPSIVEESDNPFEPYACGNSRFLVTRTSILPLKGEREREQLQKRTELPEARTPPIDFMLHAENLRADAWKTNHAMLGLKYQTLYEWPAANEERPVMTNLPLPSFVDAKGRKPVYN